MSLHSRRVVSSIDREISATSCLPDASLPLVPRSAAICDRICQGTSGKIKPCHYEIPGAILNFQGDFDHYWAMQLILCLQMSVGQSSLFEYSSDQEERRAQSCTMAEKLSNKSKTRPPCKHDAPTALAPQHV